MNLATKVQLDGAKLRKLCFGSIICIIFDFINAVNLQNNKTKVVELIHSWIVDTHHKKGVGWDPYPSSLRIVNWIKWILENNINDKKIISSLFEQVHNLDNSVEFHILGNHIFANAKALIFAGIFFDGTNGDIWYRKGCKILQKELREQFLKDSGHFELSPMYHSIMIEDILDLLNLSIASDDEKLITLLKPRINGMLNWLETMMHPDGNIAFFNDSVFGISSTFTELCKYADRLGHHHLRKGIFSKILPESGYTRLQNKDALLLFDHGHVGPTYQPGHAHADTLSFELSLFGKRVISNLGISTYERNSLRCKQRSTNNHSTVVIDDLNSSDVWASFRVGKRATTKKYKTPNITK